MTYNPALDCFLSYNAAIRALRLKAVVQGAVPREDELIDLLLLMGLFDAPDRHEDGHE